MREEFTHTDGTKFVRHLEVENGKVRATGLTISFYLVKEDPETIAEGFDVAVAYTIPGNPRLGSWRFF